MPKKDQTKARAEQQRVKNLERALKEERLGLVAIAKVVLQESDVPPSRILRRLEAMARSDKAKGRTKDVVLYGHAVFSRAAEQALGQPQTLFDPDVGHVNPNKVEALTAAPTEVQMGLMATEREPLADVEEYRTDTLRTIQRLQDEIVNCFQKCGPMSDDALWSDYVMRYGDVRGRISKGRLVEQRQLLSRVGRLVEDQRNGERRWTLMEAKSQ